MVIPKSERDHVFNVKGDALKGVSPGDRIFITSAASSVLCVLTRIEKVVKVGRVDRTDFVETTTGRRFSVNHGRGLGKLDLLCTACGVTPGLDRVFKDFSGLRKRCRALNTYDFSTLPSNIVEAVFDLISEGETEANRLKRAGRDVRGKTLMEVLAGKKVTQEEWTLPEDNSTAGFDGFHLPPQTAAIRAREGVLYAYTAYEKEFALIGKSGVTRRKLIHRAGKGDLKYTCKTLTKKL